MFLDSRYGWMRPVIAGCAVAVSVLLVFLVFALTGRADLIIDALMAQALLAMVG